MQVNVNGETRLSLSDSLTRRSATRLITFYQRYISPHKGFRCAHRHYHGGQSCSAYAKSMVQSHGLGAAIPLVRQRFADCGQAARMIHRQVLPSPALASSFNHAEPQRRERNANCWADSACDCATYGCPAPDINDCTTLDGCDIWPDGTGNCDGCGDVDLSGCDFNSCDGCDGCDVGGCDF